MTYKPLQIEAANIECPDCHGTNTIKYIGTFCGVVYGCGDCLNMFEVKKEEEKEIDNAEKPE